MTTHCLFVKFIIIVLWISFKCCVTYFSGGLFLLTLYCFIPLENVLTGLSRICLGYVSIV